MNIKRNFNILNLPLNLIMLSFFIYILRLFKLLTFLFLLIFLYCLSLSFIILLRLIIT
jgi:hypothetical protein